MSNYNYHKAENALNILKTQNKLQNIDINLKTNSNAYHCIRIDVFNKNGNLIKENLSVSQLDTEEKFSCLFQILNIEQNYYKNLHDIVANKFKPEIKDTDYTKILVNLMKAGINSIDISKTENIDRDKIIFREYYGFLEDKYTENIQALCQKYKDGKGKNLTNQAIKNVIKNYFDIFYLNFLINFESIANQITQILFTEDAIKLKNPELLQQYKLLFYEVQRRLGNNICFYVDFEKGFIVKNGIDIDAFQINNNLTIEDIEENFKNIETTEKETIVKSRIGQDKLRKELLKHKHCCELCGLELEDVLVASHIKPWSESTNDEKLDLENVLLLCPMHDKLFDKGYISFDNNGKIIISKELSEETQALLNIHDESYIGLVSEKKSEFLKYHRQNIFKN